MKFSLLLFIITFFVQCGIGQDLPTNRLYDWSNAGTTISFPIDENNTVINFADFSANYPNLDFALSSAIFQLAEGGTLFFPAGEYIFTQAVQVPDNITFQGTTACETVLVFDLENGGNAFNIKGTLEQAYSLLSETAFRKSNGLYVENVEPFSVGDWIKISFDDSEFITSEWAANSVGQIAQIANIQENLIIIDSELRLKYELEKEPFIQKFTPRQNVSFNSLKIVRNDMTSSQTTNFSFRYAVNCQVENVESEFCNFAHIGIYHSAHLTIKGNYFHKAHDYGGGGKGYGVALQILTSECLIENNIFDNLRHSMLLQAGANGNVLAYNYSTNPYWTGTTYPSNAAGDLVLHGNYVFANLAEGNVVANIAIDDSHGANGPHNTFLRNRTESYGLVMNSGVPTDSVNFIGNETTGLVGLWYIQGQGHFQYGNNVLGTITPSATLEEFEASLFASGVPTYFEESNSDFPPVGFPNLPVQNTLPAQSRFNEGSFITNCIVSSTSTETLSLLESENNFRIYPNPSNGHFYWESAGQNKELNIFDIQGRKVKSFKITTTEGHQNLSLLPIGIYFVEITRKNGTKNRKKLVLCDFTN